AVPDGRQQRARIGGHFRRQFAKDSRAFFGAHLEFPMPDPLETVPVPSQNSRTSMPKSKSKKAKYTPGDFKLKVRRSRTGLGLFAHDPIPKDACIIEYVGNILTDKEYNK